ncbi:MAG: hypothetical protein AAF211_31500, partial [Myxococcota bacterium]
DLTSRGQWGGLILSGRAQTNTGDIDEEVFVNEPSLFDRWFGGVLDDDDSGQLRYAIIAETGFTTMLTPDIAALHLEAVGSGTTIDHVQVVGAEDDGIATLGGTVSLSHLISNGSDDDALDFDLGWRGTLQYALVLTGMANGDRALEGDNNGDNFDAAPLSNPVVANVTLIGGQGKGETRAAMLREGWRGQIVRSVVVDGEGSAGAFTQGCIDIDDSLPAELSIRDTLVDCSGGLLEPCGDDR